MIYHIEVRIGNQKVHSWYLVQNVLLRKWSKVPRGECGWNACTEPALSANHPTLNLHNYLLVRYRSTIFLFRSTFSWFRFDLSEAQCCPDGPSDWRPLKTLELPWSSIVTIRRTPLRFVRPKSAQRTSRNTSLPESRLAKTSAKLKWIW